MNGEPLLLDVIGIKQVLQRNDPFPLEVFPDRKDLLAMLQTGLPIFIMVRPGQESKKVRRAGSVN